MFEKLESAIMVLGEKLNNNKILMVLRDSFMLAFPLTIFGSIMLVIANFPYLGKLKYIRTSFNSNNVSNNNICNFRYRVLFM